MPYVNYKPWDVRECTVEHMPVLNIMHRFGITFLLLVAATSAWGHDRKLDDYSTYKEEFNELTATNLSYYDGIEDEFIRSFNKAKIASNFTFTIGRNGFSDWTES